MAVLTDLSLGPLVGAAMHQLSHGMDAATAVAWLETHSHYGGRTTAEYQAAVSRAEANLMATTLAQHGRFAEALRESVSGRIGAGEQVGVRVLLSYRYPSGAVETASVIVNVSPDLSPAQVVETVRAMAEDGTLPHPAGTGQGGVVQTPEIGYVYEGGVEGGLQI